jgi:hypothetical protein
LLTRLIRISPASAINTVRENKNTGEIFSPVPNSFAGCRLRVVVNPRKSERTQQNCANEREHGAHRQHIELQGMIHDAPPIEGRTKCNRLCRLAEARRRYAPSLSTGRAMQIGNKASKRLITRRKKFP